MAVCFSALRTLYTEKDGRSHGGFSSKTFLHSCHIFLQPSSISCLNFSFVRPLKQAVCVCVCVWMCVWECVCTCVCVCVCTQTMPSWQLGSRIKHKAKFVSPDWVNGHINNCWSKLKGRYVEIQTQDIYTFFFFPQLNKQAALRGR